MKTGDPLIWNQTRTWGGTQGMHATFIEMRGTSSCRIRLSNGEERTVRVANITIPEHKHHWTWDTYEIHNHDGVFDGYMGMVCECGEKLSMDQVREIVNGGEKNA